MDNNATEQHLKDSIQSIIDNYELFGAILQRTADREEVERFAESFGVDLNDYDDVLDDLDEMAESSEAQDGVCGSLEDAAIDAMNDYPLSVDDSHIWFTLGGPNISANVTGWRIIGEDYPVIDVQDITLKGRWGGASVDREVWRGDFLFDQVAEMFETNLLSKFSRF